MWTSWRLESWRLKTFYNQTTFINFYPTVIRHGEDTEVIKYHPSVKSHHFDDTEIKCYYLGGLTMLMIACRDEDFDEVQTVLGHFKDDEKYINLRSLIGNSTALYRYVTTSSAINNDIVTTLVENGAQWFWPPTRCVVEYVTNGQLFLLFLKKFGKDCKFMDDVHLKKTIKENFKQVWWAKLKNDWINLLKEMFKIDDIEEIVAEFICMTHDDFHFTEQWEPDSIAVNI